MPLLFRSSHTPQALWPIRLVLWCYEVTTNKTPPAELGVELLHGPQGGWGVGGGRCANGRLDRLDGRERGIAAPGAEQVIGGKHLPSRHLGDPLRVAASPPY